MSTYQNTALTQDPSLIIGSVKTEVATVFGGSYVNVGLGRSFGLEEQITPFSVQADNGSDPIEGVAEHEVQLSMELLEHYVPTLDTIRGGIDLATVTAGVLVSGASQVVASGAWGYDDPHLVENQNGDGSELTINSVTGGTDGALVEGTDFFVGRRNLTGDTVVTIVDSVTVTTEAQTMTINYDYTPNASRNLSTGGLATISGRAYRMTNIQIISAATKSRIIDVYTAFFQSGGVPATFQSDNADDPLTVIPIVSLGKLSAARTAGDQLFKITDEVAIA